MRFGSESLENQPEGSRLGEFIKANWRSKKNRVGVIAAEVWRPLPDRLRFARRPTSAFHPLGSGMRCAKAIAQ